MSRVPSELKAAQRRALRNFDAATRRQAEREAATLQRLPENTNRGWTREELYRRGLT
jgi:hypothetical protein